MGNSAEDTSTDDLETLDHGQRFCSVAIATAIVIAYNTFTVEPWLSEPQTLGYPNTIMNVEIPKVSSNFLHKWNASVIFRLVRLIISQYSR